MSADFLQQGEKIEMRPFRIDGRAVVMIKYKKLKKGFYPVYGIANKFTDRDFRITQGTYKG